MTTDSTPLLEQALELSSAHWRAWLLETIGFDEATVTHAMKLCPDWKVFTRLNDIQPFLDALAKGKIPTYVKKRSDRSPSKKKKKEKATAAPSEEDFTVIDRTIVLPTMAIEDLKATHRFVRLVCRNTGRKNLKGTDVSEDMLDEFKTDVLRLDRMLATPESIPRLTRGDDIVAWLGKVKRWAMRVPGCEGVPLAYLVRDVSIPPELPDLKPGKPYIEREDTSNEGITLDLVEFTSQETRSAKEDKRSLYQHLERATYGTSVATSVAKGAKTEDGLAVFQAIARAHNHTPQWEARLDSNTRSINTLVPNESKPLTAFFDAFDKAVEQLQLCQENGHGTVPSDRALVDRVLKVVSSTFDQDVDIKMAISDIKKHPTKRDNYALVKAMLLEKDPNPSDTTAIQSSGVQKRVRGIVSSAKSGSTPEPKQGKTGVILNVDYTQNNAYKHLTPAQHAEYTKKCAKGDLPSWKKYAISRNFIRERKKESGQALNAHLDKQVEKRTEKLTQERDQFASGLIHLSKQRKSTKQSRRDADKKQKRKQKEVSFQPTQVGSARVSKKRRRRHEESDSDEPSDEYDSSSDDGSVSSAEPSGSRHDEPASESFSALISSARELTRERASKQKSKEVPRRAGKQKQRKHTKGRKEKKGRR